MDVFTSPSMPFYKFGDIHFLEKIAKKDWIPFIKRKFKETGNSIATREARTIAQVVECHPHYVQQLAQQTWFRTQNVCDHKTIHTAHESIVLQLSLLFQTITDELATTQINFLKAMIEGEEHPSSKQAIEKYRLGTSANVLRIKKALIKKKTIDKQANKFIILDPVYRFWLSTFYFK